MKRFLSFFVLSVSMFCTTVMASDIPIEESLKTIDGFRGNNWGTSMEEVLESEITEDMTEYIDYRIVEDLSDGSPLADEDITLLIIKHADVAGYKSDARFFFHEDALVAGEYQVDVDREQEDDANQDLLSKYTSVYGEPIVERTDSGWGPFTLWVDADKGFVFLDGFQYIVYSYIDAPCVSWICNFDDEEKYFHVNIEAEINKIGNIDGI